MLSEDADSYLVSIDLSNIGSYETKEKVQIYARFEDSRTTTPNFQLCAVKCVSLEPGESKLIELTIDKYWVSAVCSDGNRVKPDGSILLYAGSHQPDTRSYELCAEQCLEVKI